MTVDSTYKPQEFERDEDVDFIFDIESIGDEAMQAYVIVEGRAFRLPVNDPR